MRKAKQITGILMAGIMASTVLAGCINEPAPSSTSQAEAGKDSGAGSGAPAASGGQITLRFMWWAEMRGMRQPWLLLTSIRSFIPRCGSRRR